MKIVVACGGTGGHIFPGMATGGVLRERGHDVALWLAGKDVEGEAVADWPGPVVTVLALGLPSGFSLRGIRAAWKLLLATARCVSVMRRERPDVVLGMGSYASVGPVSAALLLRIPVVLHESNVLPGRAIRLLSRWATAVAGSFEATRFYLRRKDLVVTGMPLRKALEQGPHDEPFHGLDRGRFSVLVVGGSRGAHQLNETASQAICRLHADGYELQVIHLTGPADEAAIRKRYVECGVTHMVRAFVQDMASVYSMVDFAVSRAGAATCAELSAFGVPALLVPYPFATNDHQMYNARALERIGAADVVPERDLGTAWLVDYISQCMNDPGRLARMSAAAKGPARRGGAEALADLVESVVPSGARRAAPEPGGAGHA